MHRALFPIALLCFACSGGSAPDHGTTTARPPADPRDEQLRPQEVIRLMGGDLTGLTVADLFAEDGYFAFKLVAAGANVIAVVNDQANADAIEDRRQQIGFGADRLLVRVVPVGDPGIANAEADMALIVHHFVGIQDKAAYFKQLRSGLRYPRPLIMLEWQGLQTMHGPPASERMGAEEVMDLIGTTGYAEIGAHSDKIPEQVIYVINDYFDPSQPAAGQDAGQ